MLVPTVRVQTFPNNEIRATFYYARDKKEVGTPDQNPGSESPLDITSKVEPSGTGEQLYSSTTSPEGKLKPGYGIPGAGNGLTNYGRRQLLRAGAVLDELAVLPGNVLFATLTLPGSTYEAKKAMAAWSGYATHLVRMWFNKRAKEGLDMHVWEFQKRGALHLHYATCVTDDNARKWLIDNWKAQATRVIDAIGKKAGVDMWRKNANYTHADNKEVLQTDIQECNKSIARYLAKYVAKSKEQYKENHWKECKPSRYYGVSRKLLAELKARTEELTHSFVNRRQFDAAYEDILSISQRFCPVGYHYEVKKVGARVIAAYSNPGERTWLLKNIATQLSSKEKLSMSNQSERVKICLSIAHYLQNCPVLLRKVLEFSDECYVDSAITTALSESESKDIQNLLILDFRWYIFQIIRTSNYVPDGLKRLHIRIVAYCRSNLASFCYPTVVPQKTEEPIRKSEKTGNLQLTVGL